MTAAKLSSVRRRIADSFALGCDHTPGVEAFEALFARAGLPAFIRDAAGRFVWVNNAYATALSCRVEDIVGRHLDEVEIPDTATRTAQLDRLVLADGRPRRFDGAVHEVSGEQRRHTVHLHPIVDGAGRRLVAGTSFDITELWSRSRQRVGVDSRLQAVFEYAPVGQIYSGLDGIIESVNETLAQLLGYRPEEMVGRPTVEFVSPSELGRMRAAVARLLADTTAPVSDIRRFWHRDGHEVPVRVTSWVLTDEDGTPETFASMAVDLTDEERNREELALAHDATMRGSRRIALLNAVATVANEAATIAEHASRVFAPVCDHFDWTGGALVHWTAQGAATAVRTSSANADAMARSCTGLAVPDAPVTVIESPGAPTRIVVALSAVEPTYALVFTGHDVHLDDDARQLLTLIGITSGRVVEREIEARQRVEGEERFRAVFDSSPLPMGLTLGDSGTYYLVNDALCALVGRTSDELIGMSARDLVHPDDIPLTDPAGAAAWESPDGRATVELRMMHTSGRVMSVMVTLAWMDGPNGSKQLLAQMHDVTSDRAIAEVRRRQAEEDTLTGVMNRLSLKRALAERGRHNRAITALFVDLDGFQMINDTSGHGAGDDVLVEFARRLRGAVRDSDLVARFGGDEYVVIADLGDDLGEQFATRIQATLNEPFETRAGQVVVTASVGIANGIVDAEQPDELVHRANAAMHAAKRRGKNRREIYGARLHERTIARRRTEAALRHALDDNRFAIHFQPIVDITDSRITGFEALVRLLDEQGELVPPGKFISVAEDSGLIVPMGTWVLREACASMVELRRRYRRPFGVAVNVAAQQATRTDFAETVLATLDDTGLPAGALTIELTESALLETDAATLAQLTELRAQGVVVGLDDFGTGYSSLAYLRSFPVSHLKVDRSFVNGLTTVSSDRAIVRSVVGLAQDLGLDWVAEGVETPEQRDALVEIGRQGYAQGYFFGRPMPMDALVTVLGEPTGVSYLRSVPELHRKAG